MNITKKQFNKAKKNFSKNSIFDAQKNKMLSSILGNDGNISTQPIISPLSSYFMIFRKKSFAVIVGVVLLISGTSYVSAQSLPGDLLYGIKTNIIEPVGLTLRFNDDKKNEYKMLLLQKRVEELEKLRERGRLDDNSQSVSSEATYKNINELENSAIFNKEGKNMTVSEKVKTYNSLIDSDFKIETNININNNENLNTQDNFIKDETRKDLEENLSELKSNDFKKEEEVEIEKDILLKDKDNSPLNIESNLNIENKLPKL